MFFGGGLAWGLASGSQIVSGGLLFARMGRVWIRAAVHHVDLDDCPVACDDAFTTTTGCSKISICSLHKRKTGFTRDAFRRETWILVRVWDGTGYAPKTFLSACEVKLLPIASCVPSSAIQPLAGEILTAFSQDLTSPEERCSKDGELRTTLRVAPAVSQAGPLAPSLNVRAYEGSVPGPTLRVKPGDRLIVNLVNDLDLPEGDPSVAGAGAGAEGDGGGGGVDRASLEGRVEAWPNVTNIHVHGLHVSPSGVGDNIYR